MRLTIVGLGVLGTSLGLALKATTAGGGEIVITGHDPDTARVGRAKRLGAVDRTHWNLLSACEGAELIILDLPLGEMEATLTALRDDLQPGTVLVDTAATKRPVMEMAARLLPEGVDLIGAHPVSLTLGLPGAEPSADLLAGAAFLLVVPERAAPSAVETASNLAVAVGATPHYVDALEHDGLVAATEHLPQAAALALAGALNAEEGRRGRDAFVGAPLLAAGAPLLMEGTSTEELAAALAANAEHLLPWLRAYEERLARLRAALESADAGALREMADEALRVVRGWRGEEKDEAPEDASSRMGGFLRGLLLGGAGRTPRPRGRRGE